MTQRRVTATNQISTVTDALQLGKKTGLLTIERGEGETFEEGTMTFLHGKVVKAAIGSYIGRDAAVKLFSWQACRFSFISMPPEHINQTTFSTPRPQTDARVVTDKLHLGSYKAPQTNHDAQDIMSRRPSITIYYKEAMDDILHILEQHGLSRMHRRVLLLIDGHRSIRDLVMLSGRSPNEVITLLVDLERTGLIQL